MVLRKHEIPILVVLLFVFSNNPCSAQDRLAPAKPVLFDWHVSDNKVAGVEQRIEGVRRFEAAEIKENPEAVARQFLGALGNRIMGVRQEAIGGEDVNKYLIFERSFADQVGDTTVVFQQSYKGVPVYGGDVRVHIANVGTLRAVTSKFLPAVDLSTVAEISPRRAMDIARSHSKQSEKLRRLPERTPDLFVYLHSDHQYHLTWVVELPGADQSNPARWKYFIDAHNGAVLSRYNDLNFQSSVVGSGKGFQRERSPLYTTKLGENVYVLEDGSTAGAKIRTFDFQYQDIELDGDKLPGEVLRNATNEWTTSSSAAAVDAHYLARIVYNYYWTVHGRNSLDDRGMDMLSSVHGTYWMQPGPGGDKRKWNNAVWTGAQMVYGDGDGVRFDSLSAGLDVVAHEFTHGITGSTAKLEYRNQSGALNESYSDVFAAMIDTGNWTIGEDVVLPHNDGNALRSLETPPRFGQPDHMRTYVVTDRDNGGVHTNSGIPNKVAYLIAAGGEHNGVRVNGLGREVTARIYYLTLTKYLSRISDFEDARRQTLKACLDLFPGDTQKRDSVANAFAAVGIGPAPAAALATPKITLVAYGDTRTGWWGLGDNRKQATHSLVVDHILSSTDNLDGVLFTGDAIMTNFPAWKNSYWKSFLVQTDRFATPWDPNSGAPHTPFFPTLGNHETYKKLPLLIESENNSLMGPPKQGQSAQASGPEVQARISKAYDAGEENFAKRPEVAPGQSTSMDLNTQDGVRQLTNWISTLEAGTPEEKGRAAYNLGKFEGALQEGFYKLPNAARCEEDAKIFRDAYVSLAGYEYLNPLISSSEGRPSSSFYTTIVERDGLKVKLIALDTNCLDYPPQFEFFQHEVASFSGPIIVFGHHAPIDVSKPASASWDKVPGWDLYEPFFSDPRGEKIRLWIFGHVHNYQRRNASPATPGNDSVSSPVLLVTGGGGASDLNDAPAGNQWQPAGWPSTVQTKKAYHYVKISVTRASIGVEVFGSPAREAQFQMLDSFTIKLE